MCSPDHSVCAVEERLRMAGVVVRAPEIWCPIESAVAGSGGYGGEVEKD
jgi:hypothetical protein